MEESFSEQDFINDVVNIGWDDILQITDGEMALNAFSGLFPAASVKQAPMRRFSVRSVKAPWL